MSIELHRAGRSIRTHRTLRMMPAIALAAASLAAATTTAQAHPHAWVQTRTEVVYEQGAITALRHTWVFDAYYTEGATEGLDKNKDGKFDQSELAELTQVNMDGLKEFGYFTEAKLDGKLIGFGAHSAAAMAMELVDAADAPNSSVMPSSDSGPQPPQSASPAAGAPKAGSKVKLLSLTFTLPLKEKVASTARGFEFSVRDPSIFIWFELAPKNPVRLVGAPDGCTFDIGAPAMSEEQKRLQDAFGGAGGLATMIGGSSKSVRLACAAG